MLFSVIVRNRKNFKEIEETSLTALGDLDWNDPLLKLKSYDAFMKKILC